MINKSTQYLPPCIPNYKFGLKRMKINQYSKNMRLIKQFESIAEASTDLNISAASLSLAIKHKRFSHGFYWTQRRNEEYFDEVFMKHPLYNLELSNKGRVKGPGGIITFGQQCKAGYFRASLYKEKRKMYVHRLIMMTWCPTPNHENLVVDHIDNDPSNNNIENLQWLTPSENVKRSIT